ncbi:IS4 transposase [Escherichia coli]|nr:IS4 transposase [Escherichia coli]
MHMGQALDLVSRYDSPRNPLTSLGAYLDPALNYRCPAQRGSFKGSITMLFPFPQCPVRCVTCSFTS